MNREWIVEALVGLVVCVVLMLFVPAAQAGPPLICWPFDIGGARSLPWGGSSWHDARADYDLKRLAGDTLALLAPDAPVLVRMETMRRAAIYAQKDAQAAKELFARLEERAEAGKSAGKPDARALFDLGYFAEASRQAGMEGRSSVELGAKRTGYELVEQALALHGPDPEMEFAAALMRSFAGQRDVGRQHLAKAAAGAAEGSLLARNLVTHCHLLQIQAGTLAELRSQVMTAKK